MKPHIIKSPGALALGVFFACVTGVTILKDVVMDGASFNLTHVQSIAAMVAAIAAGHFVLPTLMQGRIPPALGLAFVFIAATGYIVISAGARNAEVSSAKMQGIEKRNVERASAREVLVKAEAETIAAKDAAEAAVKAAAAECATGKGKNCAGKMATREAAKDDLAATKEAESLARGKLLILGPDEDVHQGYRSFATILEAINIGTADKTAAILELGVPFALVLITEVAALVFIGMGLGHVQPPAVTSERPAIASDTSGQTDYPALSDADLSNVRMLFAANNDDPPGPKGGTRKPSDRKWTKDELIAELKVIENSGQPFPSQQRIVEEYGVARATLSDWLKDSDIKRQKVGRRVMVG